MRSFGGLRHFRACALILIAYGLMLGLPARAENVALTFDDLPAVSLNPTPAYLADTTRKLLAALKRHHVPATGFVNENKLEFDRAERVELLRAWLDAGMDLGNHTYSHLSLTRTPVDTYVADVLRGETVTRWLLAQRGRTPRWFRHPFLETGNTLEDRRTFEAWLMAHGYRVAPVSMENSDWMFAFPYDAAVDRRDQAAADHIKQEYLAWTADKVAWYRKAAYGLLGRRPAFVFLLHVNRLNADSMDELYAILLRNELHPVSLERAMADPAYMIADNYIGPDGMGWLTRWSLTLHKPLPWGTLPQPPSDLVAATKQLDPGPS